MKIERQDTLKFLYFWAFSKTLPYHGTLSEYMKWLIAWKDIGFDNYKEDFEFLKKYLI